jgi:hydroxypyruvate reductase
LARATKAKVISLILSDVIGNPLEAIASGPTYPNPTTNKDALAVLGKYGIDEQVPKSIMMSLRDAERRSDPHNSEEVASRGFGFDILNPADTADEHRLLHHQQHIIIGDNKLAAQAALKQAQLEGFDAEILTNELQGEAREVGTMLARKLRDEITKRKRPFCLIAGGETTVTIKGSGKGGRNQELALAAVNELRGLENVMLISLATDGEDGPTDAAGAVATGESAQRAEKLEVDAADHLSRNDAYAFFDASDDLIRIGPTGTNVNDLVFLFAM